MNVIVQLEFKLASYDITVQHINHNVKGSPQEISKKLGTNICLVFVDKIERTGISTQHNRRREFGDITEKLYHSKSVGHEIVHDKLGYHLVVSQSPHLSVFAYTDQKNKTIRLTSMINKLTSASSDSSLSSHRREPQTS